jgi:hypothetical protein
MPDANLSNQLKMFIMDNQSQIEVLNDLVVKNRDSQHGYKEVSTIRPAT